MSTEYAIPILGRDIGHNVQYGPYVHYLAFAILSSPLAFGFGDEKGYGYLHFQYSYSCFIGRRNLRECRNTEYCSQWHYLESPAISMV
jgi:hypothetical protein